MGMFARRRPARPASDGYSVIDDQLAISGDISTEGTIRVDGRIEGTLHRADTLIIGAAGIVIGNVEAREVVIGGELTGSMMVSGRVEVQKTATVRGDIRAAAVALEEGGTVHGHVMVHALDSDMPAIGGGGERRLMLTPSRSVAAVSQG
ncbi:MAG TPA: polymer-forming cytoskeletal protein [Gemmatimonadaceae bacterium]|nr:polymer-forming cytoskeletal protein [Gemmatimonadaceae bacterium]